MRKEPWEVKRTVVAHANPFYKIVREDFKLQSGEEGEYYLVDAADFVAIIAQEGEFTYWVDLYRYALKGRSLELTMGAIEENEDSLAAAQRELLEEAGIRAQIFFHLGNLAASKGQSAQRFDVFVARNLTFLEPQPDRMESAGGIKCRKFKNSEVEAMIKSGEINDSHSLAAWQLFMFSEFYIPLSP